MSIGNKSQLSAAILLHMIFKCKRYRIGKEGSVNAVRCSVSLPNYKCLKTWLLI